MADPARHARLGRASRARVLAAARRCRARPATAISHPGIGDYLIARGPERLLRRTLARHPHKISTQKFNPLTLR
jgi:hypothetical protein